MEGLYLSKLKSMLLHKISLSKKKRDSDSEIAKALRSTDPTAPNLFSPELKEEDKELVKTEYSGSIEGLKELTDIDEVEKATRELRNIYQNLLFKGISKDNAKSIVKQIASEVNSTPLDLTLGEVVVDSPLGGVGSGNPLSEFGSVEVEGKEMDFMGSDQRDFFGAEYATWYEQIFGAGDDEFAGMSMLRQNWAKIGANAADQTVDGFSAEFMKVVDKKGLSEAMENAITGSGRGTIGGLQDDILANTSPTFKHELGEQLQNKNYRSDFESWGLDTSSADAMINSYLRLNEEEKELVRNKTEMAEGWQSIDAATTQTLESIKMISPELYKSIMDAGGLAKAADGINMNSALGDIEKLRKKMHELNYNMPDIDITKK